MELLLDIIRWMIALPTGLLFGVCILGNWSLIIGIVLRQIKSCSLLLPFSGPVFGIIFLVVIPIQGMAQFWWVAPLVEPTWLLGFWCLVALGFGCRGK